MQCEVVIVLHARVYVHTAFAVAARMHRGARREGVCLHACPLFHKKPRFDDVAIRSRNPPPPLPLLPHPPTLRSHSGLHVAGSLSAIWPLYQEAGAGSAGLSQRSVKTFRRSQACQYCACMGDMAHGTDNLCCSRPATHSSSYICSIY